jgi:type IV pilus assembly protein PilM
MINLRFRSEGLQPIGLDIGHDSIKMIQLAIKGDNISVAAAEKIRIDPRLNGDGNKRREFVVSAIKQKMTEGKFRGKDVVSCLPNDELKITSLRLAEAEAEGIERALRKEALQRFGMDTDKDIINYVIAGTVRQGEEIKNELILFGADSGTIRNHIEMLEEARLRPVAIDAVPCALFRSFKRTLRRQEDSERTVVFVDVGGMFTTVVFGQGRTISFIKQLAIGGERFNREIADKLGIGTSEADMLRGSLQRERRAGQQSEKDSDGTGNTPASIDAQTRQVMADAIGSVCEELSREISRCFNYHTVTFRGKSAERAVLTGGGAYEDILLDVMRRQLGVEVDIGEPLKGMETAGADTVSIGRGGLHCEWAVAVGLGLKGWDGESEGREATAARGGFADKRVSDERN